MRWFSGGELKGRGVMKRNRFWFDSDLTILVIFIAIALVLCPIVYLAFGFYMAKIAFYCVLIFSVILAGFCHTA